MTEIKVKKENVLKALAKFKSRYGRNSNVAPTSYWIDRLIEEIFLEDIEEEKKESELDKILDAYWMHVATSQGNYKERTEELKQQIIDLVKKKVDTTHACGKRYPREHNNSVVDKLNEVRQGLEDL